MNIFIGNTQLDDYKFSIELTNKEFKYDGDEDFGYFLEDIVFHAVDSSLYNLDDIIEVLVEYNGIKYYIVFGDGANSGGESTIAFDASRLKEEQIVDLLREQVINPEHLIVARMDNENVYIEDGDNEIEIKINSLPLTFMITKTLVLKNFFDEQKWNILGILLLATIPYFSYNYVNDTFAEKMKIKTIKVSKEMAKLTAEKKKIEIRVNKDKRNIIELKQAKDIFDDEKGSEKIKKLF